MRRDGERSAADPAGRRAGETRISRWDSLLPRFSLERRVTVLVLLATVLVVGAIAAASIPLELLPSGFNPPGLAVQVPWQDAPPQEVLDKIVLPLEEELSTVSGLDTVYSTAARGFSRVSLRFDQSTDMNVAYREVRDRIERARPRLPEDADRIFILKHDNAAIPVAVVGLILDPVLVDRYDLVQNEVVLPLERIDGVAQVEVDGLEEKEVLIELDREATGAAGLNIYALAQELGSDNFSLASGTVRSGDSKLLLRSVARFPDLAALENRPVAPNVRLGDVAAVRYEEPEKRYRVRVNSRPAVAVNVLKEGDANTLEVSRAIEAAVEEMSENPRLTLVEVETIFDQGTVIKESLLTVLDSGRVGGIFALAVLFFFLRRVRLTLVITLSIPLSLLLAIVVMYFAGETLNILTLLGLMICVGLLVDNSVVVAENIYRLHREGASRRRAAIDGAGEIALAVVMATLTTVAVFLPVSLVEGVGQFFLLRLSIPISVSLVASLFVALVFVPLATYLTLPRDEERETGALDASGPPAEAERPEGAYEVEGEAGEGSMPSRWRRRLSGFQRGLDRGLRALYGATFGRLNHLYGRVLDFALAHRLDVLLALALVVAATGGLLGAERVSLVDQDEEESTQFGLQVELPETYSFEETESWFLTAEKVIEEHREEWGLDFYWFFHRTNWGQLQGVIDTEVVELTPRQVSERLMEALPERPGVKIYTGRRSENDEDDQSLHTVVVEGEDPDELERVITDLEDLFVQVEGVLGAKRSGERAPNELALVLDRDRAQRQDVDPSVFAGVVGYALRGQALPDLSAFGRQIPVRVRFEEEDRESLDQLVGWQVPAGAGGEGAAVPLSALAEVRFLDSARAIARRDKRMARTLTLELVEGEEEAARERLQALEAQIDLPEGVAFQRGRSARSNEDQMGMLFAALFSIVFIYLLMAFLFESLILPLSILCTIPLAGIGVVWMHLLVGRNIDVLGTVGLVLLIGVVVNNGIVLIDYVNRLRGAGMERREALLLATERRFRPIMMTALTTIFGMVPLTVAGASSIGLSYSSFGYTLIGGLTTATLLTLLVIPIAYTLIDDLREAVGGVLRGAGRGKGRTVGAGSGAGGPGAEAVEA